jgi:hypothetical protein
VEAAEPSADVDTQPTSTFAMIQAYIAAKNFNEYNGLQVR